MKRKFSLREEDGEISLICNDYVIITITHDGYLKRPGCIGEKTGLMLDSNECVKERNEDNVWKNIISDEG